MANQKQEGIGAVEKVLADQRRREKTYREKALKMYDHVCGRCGREFSGKRLKELTVHHRDHNHDYNPPDGSNWELLCIYCHENEHSRHAEQDTHASQEGDASSDDGLTHKPFAALEKLLNK